MKKSFAAVLSLALAAMAFGACGGNGASAGGASAGAGSSAAGGASTVQQNVTVGVIQYVAHPALDAAYEGFLEVLAEAGYVEGENLTVDYQNASGEAANCATIADKLANGNNDLILAIATPAAQAMANATKDIPILVTAVTDPADAGLVDTNEAPGGNVSGTSDLTPVRQQMELIQTLLPEAKTVGMLYNSAEDNSKFQVELAKAAAAQLGLETIDYTISDINTLQQVVESMEGKVDAVYSPTDNMIANAMSTVAAACIEAGLPIVVGEEGMVENGGLASYSISYHALGRLTGAMAVRILADGADPAAMPIEYQEDVVFIYNEDTAAALDIAIPPELLQS